MKEFSFNLDAQELSRKIGSLVLVNEKNGTKLSCKGIHDLKTDIVVVKFEELDKDTLFSLSMLVTKAKAGEL